MNNILNQLTYLCDIVKNKLDRGAISKERAFGQLEGIYSSITYLCRNTSAKKFFKESKPTEEDKKTYSTYENTELKLVSILHYHVDSEENIIPVFDDDYGQCFVILYENEMYGLGTYNFDYYSDTLAFIVESIYSKYLLEMEGK